MSFKDFKKKSKSTTIEELQKKLQDQEGSSASYKDDRLWYPQRDQATGKGSAVIRFLPASLDDQIVEENGQVTSTNGFPWVKIFSHSYKNEVTGKWYIEECPTTIGLDCPVCEANSELWNTGSESNQNIARKRKRKLQYVSNIYVVSDPATPENEGKVFLYKYGKKIYDMIKACIEPEFDDQKPVDVFDLWEGANFALRIGIKDGYTNYDKSEFLVPSPLSEDESVLEAAYESMYKLSEFISPSKFKDYNDLKARFDLVSGVTPSRSTPPVESQYEDNSSYDSVDESDVDDSSEVNGSNESEEQSDFFKRLESELA